MTALTVSATDSTVGMTNKAVARRAKRRNQKSNILKTASLDESEVISSKENAISKTKSEDESTIQSSDTEFDDAESREAESDNEEDVEDEIFENTNEGEEKSEFDTMNAEEEDITVKGGSSDSQYEESVVERNTEKSIENKNIDESNVKDDEESTEAQDIEVSLSSDVEEDRTSKIEEKSEESIAEKSEESNGDKSEESNDEKCEETMKKIEDDIFNESQLEPLKEVEGVLPVLSTQLPAVVIKKPYQSKSASIAKVSESISAGSHPSAVQFNERLDFVVGEFFERQMSRIQSNTPEKLDKFQRLFSQRIGEAFGAQWAHITAQPEVDEASISVEKINAYVISLEALIRKQIVSLKSVSNIENEISVFLKQNDPSNVESLKETLQETGSAFHDTVQRREKLITAAQDFETFLVNFRTKAIADCRSNIKLQKNSRVEFDAYASKFSHLESKYGKAIRSKGTDLEEKYKYQLKELEISQERFENSKKNYQLLSTQVIDKAAVLKTKKESDFKEQLEKLGSIYGSWFVANLKDKNEDTNVIEQKEPLVSQSSQATVVDESPIPTEA